MIVFRITNIEEYSLTLLLPQDSGTMLLHRANTCHKFPGTSFLLKKNFNRANSCHKNLRNVIFAEKKAPAAAGKTSTGLIHFIIPGFTF